MTKETPSFFEIFRACKQYANQEKWKKDIEETKKQIEDNPEFDDLRKILEEEEEFLKHEEKTNQFLQNIDPNLLN